MRLRCILLLLPLLFVSGAAQSQRLELVESVPVETTLGHPDVRRTGVVWLEMINGARRALDIEQFYISNKAGEPLEEIIRAIEAAARRGVIVRLIADARFQKTYPETIERLGKQKNISTRIIDYGKLAAKEGRPGGVQHAKFFIVDREMIFLGSQNFDWRALKHIHELGIRLRHKEAVQFYQDVFDLDWNLAATNDPSELPTYLKQTSYKAPFRFVQNGDTVSLTPTASPIGFIPDSALWDEPHMVRIIDGATVEVSLKFLGYDTKGRDKSDYRILDDALRRAASRGVKVRLLVSDWEKGTPAEKALKELTLVPNIEVRFTVIPEWSGGYVSFARVQHCKFIVADRSTFWLGTSNAEKSYFYSGRNLGITVQSHRLAGTVGDIFNTSWESPYAERVDPGVKYERRMREGE